MRFLKVLGMIVGGLLLVILAAGGIMYFLGSRKAARTYAFEPAQLQIPTDSAALAHGQYLTRIHGCADCHTRDFSGQVMIDAPPFRVVASNLTAGKGGVATYTPADFDRAIRHGIKKDGRPVIVMPSAGFHNLSDGDVAAIIAYIKSLPPVDKELPATELRVPGRIMAAALLDPAMEVRAQRARTEAPARAATAEYGAYLASVTCTYCHGQDLRGLAKAHIPGSPPPPSLVAAAAKWDLAQFKQTLRTGIRPDGTKLQAEFMPFAMTAAMAESDLDALYAHIKSIQ